MNWTKYIPGCFGFEDKKFALHHSDCQRAATMLASANQEDVGWVTYLNEIESWLLSEGCNHAHIVKEMERVKDLRSYFNYD